MIFFAACAIGLLLAVQVGRPGLALVSKLEEIAGAEEIVDAHLAAFLYKLNPRLGR